MYLRIYLFIFFSRAFDRTRFLSVDDVEKRLLFVLRLLFRSWGKYSVSEYCDVMTEEMSY